MKTKISRYAWGPIFLLLTILFACAPPPLPPDSREPSPRVTQDVKAGTSEVSPPLSASIQASQLPVRFQTPSYTIGDSQYISDILGTEEEYVVKVGADITSTSGPVVLREILKKLAALKNMNVSWASDVDQYSYVDIDIRADDDFFKSIDNLLRQRDYFHEVQGNTIVIKYKETKKFHLAMPFVNSKYDASVGAKVSQNSQSTIINNGNTFDIWDNIKKNLDEVMQIWEVTSVSHESTHNESASQSTANQTTTPSTTTAPSTATNIAEKQKTAMEMSRSQSAKGYYMIDRPIGLITVTAPRPVMEKIESYINNLKRELYKQVSIEAKILEVSVSDSSQVGIDWASLLNDKSIGITTTFGPSSFRQPFGPSGTHTFTIDSPLSFDLLLNALQKQGKTKILSNPRLSVMNGQPAIINVGKQVTYIKNVTETTATTANTSTVTVTTDEKSSGIVMSIVPTILEDNEIVLNMVPVTSQLTEPIEYKTFGTSVVGLPITNVREMSTMIKVKQGEMLVVGGLIDSNDDNNDSEVPMLGNLPLIGKLFSVERKTKTRKELVILLKPEILS